MNVPETFFSVGEELRLFLLSCLTGTIFGVYYDVFRTLRLAVQHNKFFVLLEDILFLATYAVYLLSFASAEARGELRGYYIIGGAIGFTLYYFTVGKTVIRLMQKLTGVVKSVFAVAVKPFIAVKVKFVGYSKNIVKSDKNVRSHLKNNREM